MAVGTDKQVQVRGRSMWPLLREGDRVDLEVVPAEALQPGDIIAFASGEITVLHRVLAVRTDASGLTIREKGDNSRLSSWLSADQLMGRARLRWRDGVSCWLQIPARRGLRLLTWGSRLEGDLFDRLTRVRRALLPGRTTPQRTPLGSVLSFLMMPLRLPGLLLIHRLYPPTVLTESPRVAQWSVDLFRALAANGPMPLPDDPGAEAALHSIAAHGLQALTHERLVRGEGGPPWPEPLVEALRQTRYRAGFAHLSSITTLQEVSRPLAARGLDHLVLKGPPLSWELYGEGALRPSGDIDLLVRRADLERVLTTLVEAGYRVRGEAWQQALVRRGHFHIVLDAPGKGRVPVEIHWDLVDRANLYRIDTARVFDTARPVALPGIPARVLGVEEGLAYLCLHLSKHALFNRSALARGEPAAWFARPTSGNRLLWFMDLDRYLKRLGPELKTDRLRDCMEDWNARDEVVGCLQILARLAPDSAAGPLLEALGESVAAPERAALAATPAWRDRWMSTLLRADEGFVIRPVRLLTLGQLLFPAPSRLLRYHRKRSRWSLPWLYVRHPFHMARKMFSSP